MLSEERHASRSPSESVQTDSIRAGPTNRLGTRQSQRSSITEEDDNNNVPPPAPPLPSSFRTSAKSSSSSTTSTPTQSTPKPTSNSVNAAKTINAIAFQRPSTNYNNPSQKSSSTQQKRNQKTTPPDPKRTLQALLGGGITHGKQNGKAPSTSASYFPQGKSNQSIFEKVDTHSGNTTYLGTGSFSQLESCIRNCLSQTKSHSDLPNYYTKHDYPHKSLTRASVLEDYSYDGISSPKYHVTIPINIDSHHHHHLSDHKKHAAELSLEEIRQINDALAKYNIPLFSSTANHYNKPRPVADVLSACEQILAGRSHGDAQHSVQHVWDNLHYHSPQTNMYGYASPAVQGVASHLFHPNQPPYSPVQSAASHIFNNQQQNAYNPGQSAISHLFGNPQQNSYNPGQGPPPPNYGYPPPNSNNSGQSAISRLFGNPGQGPPPPSNYPPPPSNYPPPPPPNYPPPSGYPPQNSGGAGQSVLSRLFSGQS